MNRPLLIIVLALLAACQSGPGTSGQASTSPSDSTVVAETPKTLTSVQWLDSVKQIGKVTVGEKVELAYRFVNTGDHPLVIENVVPACGCTVAEKPAEPVAPGKQGTIRAVFDSYGRIGTQEKSLTIYANTEAMIHPLVFKVEVVAKKEK